MAGRREGKACIITGTGGSMGRASALAFAREGASVIGCDVAVEAAAATVGAARRSGAEMTSMQPCRLTETADCRALVDLAIGTYRKIDVLFNLAGAEYF